jgi:hypothetical protein
MLRLNFAELGVTFVFTRLAEGPLGLLALIDLRVPHVAV